MTPHQAAATAAGDPRHLAGAGGRRHLTASAAPPPSSGRPPDLEDPASGRCVPGRCPDCSGPVHWHPRADGHHVALQPTVLHTSSVPDSARAHLDRGIVYPGANPREHGLVRMLHQPVCPARPAPSDPQMYALWRALAIRRRAHGTH